MSYPWKTTLPPAAAEFAPSEHIGMLYFFCVGGYVATQTTPFGERSAVRCTLVQLDGPNPGEVTSDVLLFNSRLVGRLRGAIGEIHLGRFTFGEGKGANAPIDIDEATGSDIDIASRYVSAFPGKVERLLAECVQSHAMSGNRSQGNGQAQNQGGQQRGFGGGGQADWRNRPQPDPQPNQPPGHASAPPTPDPALASPWQSSNPTLDSMRTQPSTEPPF